MPKVAITLDEVDVGPEFGATSATTGQPVAVFNSQSFATINGSPIVKEGDVVQNHYDYDQSNNVVTSHENVTMTTLQSVVKINGQKVIVDGNSASCNVGHKIVGTGFVTITIS